MKHRIRMVPFWVAAAMLVSACSGTPSAPASPTATAVAGASKPTSGAGPTPAGAQSAVTITIATVNNPDMQVMAELAPEFTKQTGITAKFVTLPDQQLRQQVTQDVALGTGAYDIVTIGPNELRYSWAKNKWVVPMDDQFSTMDPTSRSTYDLDDVLKPIREYLTIDGKLYGLPFYGESTITFYRKDLFQAAGLTMPEHPTWDQIKEFACKLHNPNGPYGVILKGIPDYGQIAPFMSFTNAFGLRWFDMNWQPPFTTSEWKNAAQFYVDLVQKCGEPGASSVGFNEGLGLMSQGKGAIWFDATVAAGLLADPKNSTVVDKIGYAYAPSQGCDKGRWLYSWNLSLEAASKHQAEAFRFVTWATSKDYINLVASKYGWGRVPPGTRASTYANPQYTAVAPWADITLKSIDLSDPVHPSCQETPYTGTTQIDIPEFPDFAFDFGQGLSAAVAGTKTVDQWLSEAQTKATQVMTKAGYIK